MKIPYRMAKIAKQAKNQYKSAYDGLPQISVQVNPTRVFASLPHERESKWQEDNNALLTDLRQNEERLKWLEELNNKLGLVATKMLDEKDE